MINRFKAQELAASSLSKGLELDDSRVQELAEGWFFPFRAVAEPVFGSQGVVINKATGAVFHLGSAFPAERDLELYDKGYQFARYDLVITTVSDLERTLDVLEELRLSVVEPTFEHGTVWRIPRPLTRKELRDRIDNLPCVFGDTRLYAVAEKLEKARQQGIMEFELLECPACGETRP
jgi:hypothetical protein